MNWVEDSMKSVFGEDFVSSRTLDSSSAFAMGAAMQGSLQIWLSDASTPEKAKDIADSLSNPSHKTCIVSEMVVKAPETPLDEAKINKVVEQETKMGEQDA